MASPELEAIHGVVETIYERAPNIKPKLGIILGSGLGAVAQAITQPIRIPYRELPNFPVSHVSGHASEMILGQIGAHDVVCLSGRVHFYEGMTYSAVRLLVRTLRFLGCEQVLITNAAGSLNLSYGPGSIVMLNDHINMQFGNPLVGPNEDSVGPRFFGMEEAYDPNLRAMLKEAATHLGFDLPEGVYLGVLGPSFETPAEINAFRAWGADLVGMSTVAEVIAARHCGLRVAALSSVVNYASGLSTEPLTHELTLKYAAQVSERMTQLILEFVKCLPSSTKN